MEVLGLILMVLALLLSLAFVTYAPSDNTIAASIHLGDALLQPASHQAQFRVQNALGLVGAELARALVPGFLGYTVVLLTGIVAVWGYAIFRHLELRPYIYISGLGVLSAFMLACLIGWFGQALDTDLTRWAGVVGMGVAGWMQRVFGLVGSFILLLMSITVALLLVIDHDIQRSIDRVVEFVHSVRARIRSAWVSFQERRSRRREERTQAREAARESRRQRQSEREEPAESSSPADEQPAAPAGDTAPSAEPTTSPSPSEPQTSQDTSSQSTADPSETADPDPDRSGDTVPLSVAASDHPSPLRRNDLFRERSGDAETGASPDKPGAASDTEESSREARRDPATQELDIDELEEEFSDAFDEAGLQQETSESSEASSAASEPTRTTPEGHSADSTVDETGSSPTQTAPSSDEEGSTRSDDRGPRAPSQEEKSEDAESAESQSDEGSRDDDDVELTVKERVEEEKADEIERETETPEEVEYETPTLDLLDAPTDDDPSVDMDELEENKRILLDKLKTYNIEIQEINAVVGPTVTRYEMIPAPGIKVSRIKSLEDDLAMAMAAQGVRMIAPIPGKSAVGVEIANRNRELVRLRDVIGTAKFRDTEMELPVPLGKTIEGEVFLADLTKMPHLLIAGATGSGKSVGLNGLITGLIYACHPSNLKFVIIDPKKIELQQYTHLRDHFMAQPEDLDEAVITDVDEALGVLKSCEKEMEERYDLLSEAGVRGIQQYNRKFKNGELPPEDGHRHMPYLVVVVDEMADLMMQTDKDVEGPIARLAQKARAVGIHLVLATQRPSVDVITGLIKANFPSRIAYEVASRVDSRTILDQIGAEGLVGNGDMLYLSGSKLKRIQGPFVSVEEVERVVDCIADQDEIGTYTLPSLTDSGHGPDSTLGVEDTDDKFEEGARVIVRRQQGSVSLLQRKLAVGYTRAARIVDQLEEAGIVGPFNGTKAREVLVDSEEELERLLSGEDAEEDSTDTSAEE